MLFKGKYISIFDAMDLIMNSKVLDLSNHKDDILIMLGQELKKGKEVATCDRIINMLSESIVKSR